MANCASCSKAQTSVRKTHGGTVNLNTVASNVQKPYSFKGDNLFINVIYTGNTSTISSIHNINYGKLTTNRKMIVHIDDVIANSSKFTILPDQQAQFNQYLQDNNINDPYNQLSEEYILSIPNIGEATYQRIVDNGHTTKELLIANLSEYLSGTKLEAALEYLS